MRDRVPDLTRYPYALPAVQGLLNELTFHPRVTFLIGENGSGKSTIVEALAVAAGFNAEGGSRNFRFATRSSESPLHEDLLYEQTEHFRVTKDFLTRRERILRHLLADDADEATE